eukprot:scaffold6966_cov112-Cylindrotheca_fusiformis.AAC.31
MEVTSIPVDDIMHDGNVLFPPIYGPYICCCCSLIRPVCHRPVDGSKWGGHHILVYFSITPYPSTNKL